MLTPHYIDIETFFLSLTTVRLGDTPVWQTGAARDQVVLTVVLRVVSKMSTFDPMNGIILAQFAHGPGFLRAYCCTLDCLPEKRSKKICTPAQKSFWSARSNPAPHWYF